MSCVSQAIVVRIQVGARRAIKGVARGLVRGEAGIEGVRAFVEEDPDHLDSWIPVAEARLRVDANRILAVLSYAANAVQKIPIPEEGDSSELSKEEDVAEESDQVCHQCFRGNSRWVVRWVVLLVQLWSE